MATIGQELEDVEEAEGTDLPLATSIEQLQEAIPFAEATVPVPELGIAVLIRSLSAHKRAKLMNGLIDNEGAVRSIPELQARMFAASVVAPDVSVEQARELAHTWPAPVWDRVSNKVDELSPRPKEARAGAARAFPDPDE